MIKRVKKDRKEKQKIIIASRFGQLQILLYRIFQKVMNVAKCSDDIVN
jgi:hypothetical protein